MASHENSSKDSELEEMLRQAELLEAQLASSVSSRLGDRSLHDESVQMSVSRIIDEGLSLVYSEDPGAEDPGEEEHTDVMLLQAQLLAAKMRGPRSVTPEVEDQSDAYMDDMLHKAELLALKMKAAETSPLSSPGKPTTAPAENTPTLIRHSQHLLANMNRDHNKDSRAMTTPELMHQTKHLIEKMKASAHTGTRNLSSHLNPPREGATRGNVSVTDDVLFTSDMLLAKVKSMSSSDRQPGSNGSALFTPPSKSSSGQDTARSEELRRLMEEALSTWTSSGEDASRVKDGLAHIFAKSGSTPSTVSLSVQPAELDEMSSVGSQSPRTPPKELLSAESLTARPRPPDRSPLLPASQNNVSAAIEMTRNMATALQEMRSEASSEAGDDPFITNAPTLETATSNGHSLKAPEQVKDKTRPAGIIQDVSCKGSNHGTKEHVRSRQVPSPPRMPRHVYSEEAQYNAIMAAVNAAPSGGVSWEKVASASTEDDDYVPLVDYSKKAGVQQKSVSITSMVMPTQFLCNPRRRKSKLARRILAFVILSSVALLAWFWFNSDTTEAVTTLLARVWTGPNGVSTTEMDSSREIAGFEDVYIEDVDKPATKGIVEEVYNPAIEEIIEDVDKPATVENEALPSIIEPVNTRALQYDANVRSSPKLRMKLSQTVRQARNFLLSYIVGLTPPWERFCGPDDAAACRNTGFSVTLIGSD